MNKNKIYLIHEDDYLTHIDDKITLYLMLNRLTAMIDQLPVNRGNKVLSEAADQFHRISERMFGNWNIPVRYLFTGDVNDLDLLKALELAAPELEGYFHCDGDCESCCCPYDDEDEEDEYEDEAPDSPDQDEPDDTGDEDLGDFLEVLDRVLHCLYGDHVKIH